MATQSWFQGAWSIERIIDDRRGDQPGRLTGRADFMPVADGLDYREIGTLQLGGRSFPAERRYLWRFQPDGRIRVLFDDGSPFHSFFADREVPDHLCGEDRYSVEYQFHPESWESRWTVLGPEKDYTAETRYQRM